MTLPKTLSLYTRSVFLAAITIASSLFAEVPQKRNAWNEQDSKSRLNSLEAAERSAYWQPYLLYTAPSPYQSLLVEIDALEGALPTPEHLDALRTFLKQYCRKPGGIKVLIDDIIPENVARGRASGSLALEYIDGPPDNKTAFLYIFYFNSTLLLDKKKNPHTYIEQYPSIFIDRAYASYRAGKRTAFWRFVLLHETAHAFGLCRNRPNSDGLHCTNKDCLMQPVIVVDSNFYKRNAYRKSLLPKDYLCRKCLADLDAHQKIAPADNIRFMGPYMVRSEKNYHVITLPGFLYIHFGNIATLDQADLAANRATVTKKSFFDSKSYFTSPQMEKEDVLSFLPELAKDPYKGIREIAEQAREQLR